MRKQKIPWLLSLWCLASASLIYARETPSKVPRSRPNIVVIWGDDVGRSDVSAYSLGLMGIRRAASAVA